MEIDLILEILAWVGLILLAGFLGQFGKSFALHLLSKKKETTGGETDREADPPVDGKAIKEVVKAEKKRLKALKKQQKKEQ